MEEKRRLYFEQGAKEVWLVFLNGIVQLFNPQGEITQSLFEIHQQTVQQTVAI